jgi:hypothetical protein
MAFVAIRLAMVALCLQGAVSSAPLATPDARSDSPPPACLSFWTEARFVGLAYQHIVHIANGCSVAMSCTVATDVSPEAKVVTVPSGSRVEVVTFLGSPARTFTAFVHCSP